MFFFFTIIIIPKKKNGIVNEKASSGGISCIYIYICVSHKMCHVCEMEKKITERRQTTSLCAYKVHYPLKLFKEFEPFMHNSEILSDTRFWVLDTLLLLRRHFDFGMKRTFTTRSSFIYVAYYVYIYICAEWKIFLGFSDFMNKSLSIERH